MSYVSVLAPSFRSIMEPWFEQHDEIAVLIRYSHNGGNKSFEFFSSLQAFDERLAKLPPKTCVIVFRQKQLPLRGRVDREFIDLALANIPDNEEYRITSTEIVTYGSASWYLDYSGEGHEDLCEDLSLCEGFMIAVGIDPPWLTDNDDIVSSVVPEPDGEVITGVY